jgi:hypothetical protein
MRAMLDGSNVRFVANSRYGDWRKNDIGTIERTLALPPQNLNSLYIVTLADGTQVWATSQDVEVYEQLALF